jgi:DUF4097 and DUF4098 domain-containing protein YvlB
MPEFDRITPVTVAVRIARGTVDITAADGATVAADVIALDDSDASRQAAAGTRIMLEGDTLVVHAPESSGWGWRRSPKLGVTITVPSDSTVTAKTASADVRATGRFRAAQVNLASGDAWIDEVTGDAHLEAASGDLAVRRVGGSLRVHSSSGDLEIGDVTSDVSADAASGDISVRTAGASIKAETASGDIRIGMVRQGRAGIRSASGDVEVGVLAGTGVWLDVNTASGDTKNDLTMGSEAPATGANLELRIRTASGDIRIRRVHGDVPAAA